MNSNMDFLNFDPMVKYYDETRTVDAANLAASIRWIAGEFSPSLFPKLLEPGIGTGRIAIPLAEQGYSVHGIDVAEAMLAILADRLANYKRPLNISYQLGDVRQLPFASESFDIVVAVHLFYFIREWKCAVEEILRTLKTGGPLVLMHTGMGMEIPFVNARYKELCSEHGFQITSLGVNSTQDVTDYLSLLGCTVKFIRNRWSWTSHIKLEKAIAYVRSRAYSFTTDTPDIIHFDAVQALEMESISKFGKLETEIPVDNQIYFVIAKKNDGRTF
jgi:ubiquinone/menaquinone biosynthesis C-methylase UbiE